MIHSSCSPSGLKRKNADNWSTLLIFQSIALSFFHQFFDADNLPSLSQRKGPARAWPSVFAIAWRRAFRLPIVRMSDWQLWPLPISAETASPTSGADNSGITAELWHRRSGKHP